MLKFNPQFDQTPSGVITEGEKVKFRVTTDRNKFYDSVFLILQKDGEFNVYYKMEYICDSQGRSVFEVTLKDLPIGLFFYHFEVKFDGQCQKYFANSRQNSSIAGVPFQLSVCSKDFETPDWFKGKIMYHIFVDRFFCYKQNYARKDAVYHKNLDEKLVFLPNSEGKILNNDFYGGTLWGVAEKLDYLAELNVGVIYLSPIFQAFSTHKYDTGDYTKIDEGFGGEQAFENLVQKAREKNIRVILDGVFNHTGDDSKYFNRYGKYDSVGAYNSKQSEYYGWYDFEEYPDKYNCWWGIKNVPCVNKNSSFVPFIAGENGIVQKYAEKSIGGFRLDVVDELPQSFVEQIRMRLKKSNKDAILIGEVWEDASSKIAYGNRRRYFLGGELDSVMNYPLKDALIFSLKHKNFFHLSQVLLTQLQNYPKQVRDCLMNILGTHDTKRILTSLMTDERHISKTEQSQFVMTKEQYEYGKKLQKICSFVQYFVFGVPSIYYGEEIGMYGYADPFNREYFKWNSMDQDLHQWYKWLGQTRSAFEVLKKGEFLEVFCDKECYAFERFDEKQNVLFATKICDEERQIEVCGKWKNIESGKIFENKLALDKDCNIFVKLM